MLPVPERSTTSELAFVALLVTVNWPEAAPVVAGLNEIVKLYVLPGLMLTGTALCPVTENDCPVTLICEITTGADPSLIAEMLVLAVWPTGTAPNVTDCDEAVSVPVVPVESDVDFDETLAVQPLNIRALNKSVANAKRRPFVC